MTALGTIAATADSRMNNLAPTTNFGSDTSFRVGTTAGKAPDIDRGIIKFPVVLSPIQPVGKIIAVNLFFRQNAAALLPTLCRVHNVTGLGINFNEDFVTWDDFDLGSAWAAGGGDTDNVVPVDFTLNQLGPEDFNLDIIAMWNTQVVTRGQNIFTVILKRVNEFVDSSTGIFDSKEGVGSPPLITITREAESSAGYMAMSHAGLVVPPDPW